MKITKLTTYIVPPRWLFLKVETDEGIVGWGEPVVEGRALTVEAAVHELADYLVGKDPLLIGVHHHNMFSAFPQRRPHMQVLSGIDMALWDLAGKLLGQPVSTLLGGRFRDEIELYEYGADAILNFPRSEVRAGEEHEIRPGRAPSARIDRHGGARCFLDRRGLFKEPASRSRIQSGARPRLGLLRRQATPFLRSSPRRICGFSD